MNATKSQVTKLTNKKAAINAQLKRLLITKQYLNNAFATLIDNIDEYDVDVSKMSKKEYVIYDNLDNAKESLKREISLLQSKVAEIDAKLLVIEEDSYGYVHDYQGD